MTAAPQMMLRPELLPDTNEPLDPELLPHALDMSRPELAPLMRRYVRDDSTPSLLRRPTALLVNSPAMREASLRAELERQGWFVVVCEGPGRPGGCPVVRGQRCALRESADVALVSVDPRRVWPGTGMLPRLRCAVEQGLPSVIALEGSVDSPRMGRGKAMVGGLRSPSVIVETMDRVAAEAG